MVKKKVLEHLIDYLVDNNFDTFFLVTGGAIVPTVDYIGRKEEATYYCFQHEQSAAMAAESFYRTSGKMGVVLTTSGPGAQNLLNGICGCWYESIPCLFITGQVSTNESLDSIKTKPRQVGFQEMPVAESFKHFTKYSTKVTKAELFDNILKEAIAASLTGRPGPSLIDLPVDIQNSTITLTSTDKLKWWKKNPINYIHPDEYRNIIDKIKQSKRPLLLLGQGVKLAGGQEDARKLIDSLQIPFVVSWGGFDTISHDHPLFVGDIGVYGSRGGNYAIQNCDLLLSIGSRLDTRQTGGQLDSFSRDSYKIMVDIDANEIYKDRGIKIDLPIVKDAQEFLEGILSFTEKLELDKEWLGYITQWKNLKEIRELKNNTLTSYEFLEELNQHLPDDSIIIPDEGGNLVWTMQSIKIKGKQKLYSNFGNSSMGYGLPSAIGACMANKGPVVCIDGDGGFQMNIQELQTVKHYNLPLKIFIMNNNCYGIIKQFQDSYFDKRYIATESQDYTAPDFVKVAEAYGIKALRATKENYKEIINLAMQEEGSILVDVIIDKEQKLVPKLEYGNPLEDMSPYQTDEEIKNNMIIEMIPRRDNTQGWVTLNK
jgi:acetolactate synthase-1/2/3 large subunit